MPFVQASVRTVARTVRMRMHDKRMYQDYVRTRSPGGAAMRVSLATGKTYGALLSRGERAGQEDAMSISCIMLPCEQLRQHILHSMPGGQARDPWYGWTCQEAGGAEFGAQVVWFGCFDGHGGPSVSQLLSKKLHRVFEAAEPEMVTDTVRYTRSLGGYFGRYSGGVLERWVRKDLLGRGKREAAPNFRSLSELAQSSSEPTPSALERYDALADDGDFNATHTKLIPPPDEMQGKEITLKERATLAWLMQNPEYDGAGSTASILLVHSLDQPAVPWYSSKYVSLTTIHVGDTRFLLCPTSDGKAVPLTTHHHPDEPGEAERLSRLGAGIVTDSFGEMRWMGTLANTRAFGDTEAKRYGVTAEPEVRSHIVRGTEFAFAIGFSDGISDVMSDQEIVDLCRGAQQPQEAAKRVLKYAENLGSVDNATVLCVPLAGWGSIGGSDETKARRKKRLSQVDLYRDRRK